MKQPGVRDFSKRGKRGSNRAVMLKLAEKGAAVVECLCCGKLVEAVEGTDGALAPVQHKITGALHSALGFESGQECHGPRPDGSIGPGPKSTTALEHLAANAATQAAVDAETEQRWGWYKAAGGISTEEDSRRRAVSCPPSLTRSAALNRTAMLKLAEKGAAVVECPCCGRLVEAVEGADGALSPFKHKISGVLHEAMRFETEQWCHALFRCSFVPRDAAKLAQEHLAANAATKAAVDAETAARWAWYKEAGGRTPVPTASYAGMGMQHEF
jgi:hypothetical protein